MAIIEVKRYSLWAQPCRLSAAQYIRRLRGGTQAHLIRASDDRLYVTKFKNNPHRTRALASEFLATRIGLWLGLPMPRIEVIQVSDAFIADTAELRIQRGTKLIPCRSGLQVASLYVPDIEEGSTFDELTPSRFQRVVNQHDFVRALVFDKWTGNCDSRQAIFTKRAAKRSQYEATFIDQHYCFNAAKWTFPDLPWMGAYDQGYVYRDVSGWESFEPALSHAEKADYIDLWKFAAETPGEWYHHDAEMLLRLIDHLYKRRSSIRELITSFRTCSSNPFPRWRS
jgi:hypothetical protein